MTIRLLICICALGLGLAYAGAQQATPSFSGAAVAELAKTIAAKAKETGEIPTAYRLQTAPNATSVITAPTAFELVLRACKTWKETDKFPQQVTAILTDLKGPTFDPRYEPAKEGELKPVLTRDLGKYSPDFLAMIDGTHLIPKNFQFGEIEASAYSLTAAQVLVAYAMLIDTTIRDAKRPAAIAVPLVHSPRNWTDATAPVLVLVSTGGDGGDGPVIETATVTLQYITADAAVAQLTPLAPNVVAKATSATQLFLSGARDDLDAAKALLATLDVPVPPPAADKTESVPVVFVDPASAAGAVNAAGLGVTATAEEMQVTITGPGDKVDEAMALVRRLDVPPTVVDKVLPVQYVRPDYALGRLRAQFPQATLQLSPDGKGIQVSGEQAAVDAIAMALTDVDVPPPPVPTAQISVNGIAIPAFDPKGPRTAPTMFCGDMDVAVTLTGPVQIMAVFLDKERLNTYPGPDPRQFTLASAHYADGVHQLVISIGDTLGRPPVVYYFPVAFMNGRQSNLNTMQRGNAQPGK